MTLVAFWYVVLVVVWTGFLLLEGFDFGVGMLHGWVGHDEVERDLAIGAISPVWDGNEVWLIVAAAATFAAFPVWYATMFSSFYPLFLVVLVALILRGVSFEFRAHSPTAGARMFWGRALTGGSLVIPLGLGIVLGGLLGGVPIDAQQEFVGTVADLFRPYALATGVTVVLVCLVHGAVFLMLRTTGEVRARAMAVARALSPAMAVVVVGFAAWTRVVSGHGVLLSVVEFAAVLAAIAAAALVHAGREGPAFAATSATIAAVVVSIFSELYPRVMVSSLGPANDLTVANTASASYSLTVMTIVLALLLPVVLVYQGWTYHVFRARLGGGRSAAPGPGAGGPSGAGAGGPSGAAVSVPGPRPSESPLPAESRSLHRAEIAGRPTLSPLTVLAVWLLAVLVGRLIGTSARRG